MSEPEANSDADLVSVLIAARNAENFVAEAVTSVLDQSHPHMEVVVVDDASTDATGSILDQLATGDERVRVVHRKDRAGPAVARNEALARARGAFIAFFDADDRYRPDTTARALAHLRAHPDHGAVYRDHQAVDVDMRPLKLRAFPPPPDGDLLSRLLLFNGFQIGAVLLRREVVDAVGGLNERVVAGEDWDLWIRVAQTTTVGYVPGVAVDYRTGPGRRSTDLSLKRQGLHSLLAEHEDLAPSDRRRLRTGVHWSRAQLEWGLGSRWRAVAALVRLAIAARTPKRVAEVRAASGYRDEKVDRSRSS